MELPIVRVHQVELGHRRVLQLRNSAKVDSHGVLRSGKRDADLPLEMGRKAADFRDLKVPCRDGDVQEPLGIADGDLVWQSGRCETETQAQICVHAPWRDGHGYLDGDEHLHPHFERDVQTAGNPAVGAIQPEFAAGRDGFVEDVSIQTVGQRHGEPFRRAPVAEPSAQIASSLRKWHSAVFKIKRLRDLLPGFFRAVEVDDRTLLVVLDAVDQEGCSLVVWPATRVVSDQDEPVLFALVDPVPRPDGVLEGVVVDELQHGGVPALDGLQHGMEAFQRDDQLRRGGIQRHVGEEIVGGS